MILEGDNILDGGWELIFLFGGDGMILLTRPMYATYDHLIPGMGNKYIKRWVQAIHSLVLSFIALKIPEDLNIIIKSSILNHCKYVN